jgi:hypothetical protein
LFAPATAVPSRKRVLEQENQEMNEEEDEEDEEAPFVYEPPKFASLEVTDPHRLSQRQKQVDLGKNTLGYQNYAEKIPRQVRQRFNPIHPLTPDIKDGCSKRCFDGKIKAWRRALHFWDVLPGEKCDNRIVVQTKQRVKRVKMETEEPEGGPEDASLQPSQETKPSTIFDDFDM